MTVSDANVWIPDEVRERLADVAAGEGLSLRAYLVRLSDTLPTPAGREQRVERARAALHKWNGYAPTPMQTDALDRDLDRRLGRVLGR